VNSNYYDRAVKITAGVLVIATLAVSVFYVMSIAPRLGIVVGSIQYVALGTSLLLPQAFLQFRATDKRPKGQIPWYDFLAALLSFAIPFFVFVTYNQARAGGWGLFPPTSAFVLGIILILLVIEGARRTGGNFFVITVIVCGAVPLFAHVLPGFLQNLPVQPGRVIGTIFLTSNGIFGSVMQTFVLVFLLYIFFGVLIQVVGGGTFFNNIALALLGHTAGGAAKVAVISSSLFGMISGSASANVSVDGAVTIPMMKKAGYKPHFAAAVEAAASEGGAIMPPVMGAVAFIMADFLGLPYWRIALAAIVPAILYYWCLFSQVHFHAINHGMKGLPRNELPPLGKSLLDGWHVIATVLVLVWLLFVQKVSPGKSVLIASVAFLLFSSMRKSTRPNPAMLTGLLQGSARVFGQLAAIILAIGVIIGGIGLAGIDMSLTQWLESGTHSVWVGLLSLAIAAFVLGTGMPGSAIYLLLAVLMAPPLETFGLNRLAIHMTILYWGLLADFTPPTAVGPMIAAGYAGASPIKTCLQTMRLGAVLYVAPLFFIFHPVILFEEFKIVPFLYVVASAFLGFRLVARAFEGYPPPASLAKNARRLVALASGIMILSMLWYLQVAGMLIAAGLTVLSNEGKFRVPFLGRSSPSP